MVSGRPTIPDLEDTIVALASAPGPGARAIVRFSGPTTALVVRAVMPAFWRDPLAGRLFLSGDVVLPEVHSPLPADLYFWPGPHTYTGQDVAELHTISSMPLVNLIVAQCLQAGARAAQPGEFTMRAFLAGKLDLTQAEAVLAVVDAESPAQLQHALTQLAGGMTQPLHALREDLLNLLADVEAGLDFSDEDIQFVDQRQMLGRLTNALAHVTLAQKQIASRARNHRHFRAVLAGPPNVGKSSLFNVLVGGNALVSPEPGTTRDYLEGPLVIDGIKIHLVDTAGQRSTKEMIENSAQALGQDQIAHADVVLCCRSTDGGDFETIAPAKRLDLKMKADLGTLSGPGIAVSAASGTGLGELLVELSKRARSHGGSPLAPSLSRCRHHVDACLAHLRAAHHLVLEEQPTELLAVEIRLSLEELGAIVGAVFTDDLLDRVFSRFCIGK